MLQRTVTRGAPPAAAIVWRGDAHNASQVRLADTRFAALASALAQEGFAPEPCLYDEAAEPAVESLLVSCAAAIVFVNPLQDGRRRAGLDAILRRVAQAGTLLGAHPDVIDRLGVKAVLWQARELGCGSEVAFWASFDDFARHFPARLASGPQVLKPNRGNGGQGVWRIEANGSVDVTVQAADGDAAPRTMSLASLIEARRGDFAEAGGLVDQVWLPRIAEGMVRCYMAGERVCGFGAQQVRALAPANAGAGGPRLYSGPGDARFQRLRALMENEWTPGLCQALGLEADDLPVIWDADFLLGDKDAAGQDSYVLCEINASAVFPLPQSGPAAIAKALAARLARVEGAVVASPPAGEKAS